MKNTVLLTLLLICNGVFSQTQGKTMSVVVKVERNQVLLKWFPSSFDDLKQLIDKGAAIDRVETKSKSNPETVDFTGATSFKIDPAQSRFNALDKNAPEINKFQALLEPLLQKEKPASDEAKNYAFALAILENSVSESFGELLGCQLKDASISKGKTYAYRIQIDGVKTAYAVISTGDLTEYPKIDNFTVSLDQKKAVELRWNSKKYQELGYGFQLEKSIDSPKEGNYMTAQPYVPARSQDVKEGNDDFFRDLDLKEGKTHYYRLIGLNYFGQPAMYSEWQKIYIPNHVHADVYIDSIYAKGQERIVFGGATSYESKAKNISGYALYQSKQKDSGYQLLETKKTTDSTFTFSVKMEKTGDQFYYKVVGFSADNDSVYSLPNYFFTLDQEAPNAPTAITGTIDSLGLVRLHWTAPKDTDLQGYKILRANAKNEDFTERNNTFSLSTDYIDTVRLDNLTSEIYYCIRSVDQNYNNSVCSDTIILIKPDTIAPVASRLTTIDLKDSVLNLTWSNSPSTDIANNILLRVSNHKIDTLLTWNNQTQIAFTDNKLIPGHSYEYQIITVDKSKNRSVSEIRNINYEPGYRNPVQSFNAVTNRNTKAIDLSWTPPTEEVYSYQIYRTTGDSKPILIKTIEDSKSTSFTDRQINIGNQYKYYVKYILQSGIHSLPSKRVEVTY